MTKLIIFELDGGTWDIINPLIEQGRLPNLAQIKRQGAWGILRSIKPMISAALWTTIFTGKTREQHGVQTFDAGSEQVRCPRLWDIAHGQGLVCGTCGSLSTWPPYDIGAFMIPDIMARGSETIPAELSFLQEMVAQQLRKDVKPKSNPFAYAKYAFKMQRAGVTPQTLSALFSEVISSRLTKRPQRESYWRRSLLLQQIYADAFSRLYRTYRPDLATYHYHVVDTLSHRYWHYAFPDAFDVSAEEVERYHDVIPSAYRSADRILGQFLRLTDHDTAVMVLSDHGFHTAAELFSRHVAHLPRWMTILDLEQTAFPTRLGLQHYLYFNNTARIEEIAQALTSTYVKEEGNPVFRKVEIRDNSLLFEPELAYAVGTTVVIPGYGEWPFEELLRDTGHVTSGGHHSEGIVLAAGPGIHPGTKLQDASVLDATPNMLALLGLPVARDMEGKIWEAMFTDESLDSISYIDSYETEERTEVSADYTAEEKEALYQRLQDLGYL